MSADNKSKKPAKGGRKKKALAEIPEQVKVSRDKMAAFFAPEKAAGAGKTAKKKTAPNAGRKAAGGAKAGSDRLPATEAILRAAAAANEKLAAERGKTSPGDAGKPDMGKIGENENNLVKGGKIMSEKEQVVVKKESGGGNLLGLVALFASIAALALVWFYVSTSSGGSSPSVLTGLQKSQAKLAVQVEALSKKVDSLEAKLVAAEKEKLAKSVASSLEALKKLEATADPKTAEMLKKMEAEMQKMLAETAKGK
ncbi:MAG: hypothetical protein JRJ56_03435 [Deltaproteobacteria bacterium]|nr:hypothetical protein [Deltaproteobacteria bacterium]